MSNKLGITKPLPRIYGVYGVQTLKHPRNSDTSHTNNQHITTIID